MSITPTKGGAMKVQIKVTVDVDPSQWADEYGCDRDEVRQDVRSYLTQQILNAPGITDTGLTVRVA